MMCKVATIAMGRKEDLHVKVGGMEQKGWRLRASIPLPPACEAGALPFELSPQYGQAF